MQDEEKQKNYDLAEKLISEQNFTAAIVAGAIATVLAATAYGVTVATWPVSYGFVAAGAGLVIGLSVGFLGRGISTKFAVAATLFTIISGVLGNLCRAVIELAPANSTTLIDALRSNPLSVVAEQAISNVSLVDLVYWFIAVFCAVFFARRPLSRSDRLAIGLYEMHRDG